MSQAENMLAIWKAGRTYFNKLVSEITEEELKHKLHPDAASLGFLLRHIAEADLSLANMFFGVPVTFERKTLGPVKDDGQHTSLAEIKSLVAEGERVLTEAILATTDAGWDEVIESRMGLLSRREAIGRLCGHTSYHAGQIGWARKYGEIEMSK